MRSLINSDSHDVHAMAMVHEYKEAVREVADSDARKKEVVAQCENAHGLLMLPWEIEKQPAVIRHQRALMQRRDIENYLRTIPCLSPSDWQLGYAVFY